MNYPSILGIDVASNKLDICYLGEQGLRYTQIDYTDETLDHFLMDNPELTPVHCLIGVESTGDYHLKVVKYFLNKKFPVKIINPIVTKQYTRATIRGTKTDKKDSEIIVKLIQEGNGDLADLKAISNREKELLRLSGGITKHVTALKQRLDSLKRKELSTDKIELEFTNIIKRLEEFSDSLTDEATVNRSRDEELIDTIPGFAIKLSAIIHHEIGDINRFDNVKQLVAYAGLDPRIKQSGKKLNTCGRITKRGSKTLRSALFLAANTARQHDRQLAEYYAKKKQEGRSHKEILCIISRKLLARICVVLKEQRPYEKR